MKHLYFAPKMAITYISDEDVIRTSTTTFIKDGMGDGDRVSVNELF